MIGKAELSTNIEFLDRPSIVHTIWDSCIYLTADELSIILKLVKSTKYSQEIILKLLKPVKIESEKKCWFRSDDWSHYSYINKKLAHRVSFEIFREPIKYPNEACHNCDRKGCINPWHLFQGSHSDNMKDSRNKGNKFNA